MLLSLDDKMFELWEKEGDSESFKVLDSLKDSIANIKEVMKKEVFVGVNDCCKSQQMHGYNVLVSKVSELDYKKIVYATFSKKVGLYVDGRLNPNVKDYIDSVILELELANEIVYEEYRLYEHPVLWSTLLYLVKEEGYVERRE